MLLAIDAGNTNIVFALYQKGAFSHIWRLQTRKGQTEDEYAASLKQLFENEHLSFEVVQNVIISSVVPDVTTNLCRFSEKYFSIKSQVVDKDYLSKLLEVRVEKPHEVGADRLVNALAATKIVGGPAIVIDFGTATTFDVISADKAYIGGVIAPGINLSMKALYEAAAKLPDIELKKPSKAIGTDTVSAMQSGAYWGYVGLINDILGRIQAELGETAPVIATGGLASFFQSEIHNLHSIEDNLILKGLIDVFEANQDISRLGAA